VKAVLGWYLEHVGGDSVYLLTSKKSAYLDTRNVIDVNDFVKMYQAEHPELENFIGFGEEDTDIDMVDEGGEGLFEPHLDLSEILLGVKEGRYF